MIFNEAKLRLVNLLLDNKLSLVTDDILSYLCATRASATPVQIQLYKADTSSDSTLQ